MGTAALTDKTYITLARIGRSRGVEGEFYIWPLAEDRTRFNRLKNVYLVSGDRRQGGIVESFAEISGKAVIKIAGIDSPEEARRWANGYLEIDVADRVELPEGQYFQDDLIGLNVVSEFGEILGKIEKVLENPANDIYLCRMPDGRSVLIPAVENVIAKIDIAGGKMIVLPMPGLFDDPDDDGRN